MQIEIRPLKTLIEGKIAQNGDKASVLTPNVHPDLVQISIRTLRNDEVINQNSKAKFRLTPFQQVEGNEPQSSLSPKQIPIISDIERIKKVIEILEFVGDKVGVILESLPDPQAQTSLNGVETSEKRTASNETSSSVEVTSVSSETVPTLTKVA